MTGTENALLLALVTLIAIIGGVLLGGWNKVPKSYCNLKHEGFEGILETQFKGVNERLERIEKTLGGVFSGKDP